jgi:hypothetical protein
MALHWNISKCDESKAQGKAWPLTHALIWATITVGINKITKQTADEFYARLHTYETMYGTLMVSHSDGSPAQVETTHQDIVDRIGLVTNASNMTRKQWLAQMSRMMNRQVEDALYDIRRNRDDKKEAA